MGSLNRQLSSVTLLLILGISSVFFTACGAKDADKIGDAQICLDKITTANNAAIDNCLTKISGIKTEPAYLIRCSANFMKEGFGDSNKFVTAIGQLSSNSTTASNPTVGMMSLLVFQSQGTDGAANKAFATDTYNYCHDAGSTGFTLLAGFARLATTIFVDSGGILNGGPVTGQQLQDALTNIVASGASDQVIGSTAIGIYQTSCNSGNQSNAALCATLATSVTSSDPLVVGALLSTYLKNH